MLAAGRGTRLRPLTWERPKALCPIGASTLLDLALAHLTSLGLEAGSIAVNAHHLAPSIVEHVGEKAHVSIEPVLLGTGGALGHLRAWIDGRSVVLVNADAVHDASVGAVLDGWDGERLRFLALGGSAGRRLRLDRRLGLLAVVIPWAAVATLPDAPCSISDELWTPWERAGRVEIVTSTEPVRFFDCGTPASYLRANLWESGGASVVGEGGVVHGAVERCVVWPGAVVASGERLHDAIRTTAGRTVLVRRPARLSL